MRIKKQTEEVFIKNDRNFGICKFDLNDLKKKIDRSPRKRLRICIHKSLSSPIQEMYMLCRGNTYNRPHKHGQLKEESFFILEGSARLFLFDEKGEIKRIIKMGDYVSGNNFYYKMESLEYSCLLSESDYLFFVEITSGPFVKSDTLSAPWAPMESDLKGVEKFMQNLKKTAKSYKG